MANRTITDRENMVIAARMTNNNEIMRVAEVLNETNDVIADAPVQRSTDITSHMVSRRTRLPAPEWVKIGAGWDATTGTVQQVRETMGNMHSRFLAPQKMMDIQPNPAKYRSNQERAHIEGMSQEFSNKFINGSTKGGAPEEFDGLQARYNTLSTDNTGYVLSNGASSGGGSSLTSIWFIQWREDGCYLITPRFGNGTGIGKEDKGLVYTLSDSSSGTASQRNKQLWAFITEFEWTVGLAIEDTRTVKRLCNISTVSGTDPATLDEDKVIQIRNNYRTRGMGTIYMYVNETLGTQLDILAKDKTNVYYQPSSPWGDHQLMFQDMPVRRMDAIATDEALVTT
ncbi:hypothetical protein LCGC14_0434560 [marine sediment metagenome]|uniref:Capsid protein n=1 Tax=marine sediment metagenome TaxID=412755 RepID=A0A0F9V977_9ZZZZ